MTTAIVLAYDPNDVKPGWVALLLVIALGVATYLLWRSMNTQLGKIQVPTRAELREARSAGLPGESAADERPTDDDSGPISPR